MGWCFTTPSRIANKNAAPSNDRRLSANVSGCQARVAPLRCRHRKHTRNRGALSKSKAPKAFADGAEMSLRSIAISVP